jgi:hypothetical protein
LLDALVDAIDFAGDGEVGCGLLMLGGVQHLVNVGHASKTGDLRAGDVLLVDSVSMLSSIEA